MLYYVYPALILSATRLCVILFYSVLEHIKMTSMYTIS